MSQKLTKKLVDSFEYRGDGKKDIRWDAEMKGFGVRIYPSGKKSFVISYRQAGRKKLMVLDQYGRITVEQARVLARKRFGEIADFEDPLEIKKAIKKKHKWTVRKAFGEFMRRYAKQHNKHWQETERIFKSDVLPKYAKVPLDEIKREHIIKILDEITGRGSHIMANRTLASLRKFFGWCVERGIIETAPTSNIRMPSKPVSRDLVLMDEEIIAIWGEATKIGYPFGHIIKVLLLTGQRRSEVASMKWKDIDLQNALWTLPREDTKSDREHTVPLSSLVVRLIKDAPNLGGYIFSSTGLRPFENFSRNKDLMDRNIKDIRAQNNCATVRKWRIHDLRRTATSGMARLGISPHVVEKILNHSSGIISGVAAVYNRYEYAEEKRAALTAWDEYLDNMIKNSDIT